MSDDTVDYTSGESYGSSGVTLKASASDGGVITPMTTLHEHSADQLTGDETFSAVDLAEALGLPDGVDILTYNTHDTTADGYDEDTAHEV